MFPLDSPVRKSARIRHKTSLDPNIDSTKSPPSPPLPLWPRFDDRDHTTYKDQVAILRSSPREAKILTHYMETGRSLRQNISVVKGSPKQRSPTKPRRRHSDVSVQNYRGVFEQDASDTLNGSAMDGSISEQDKMMSKINASGEFARPPNRVPFTSNSQKVGRADVTDGPAGDVDNFTSAAPTLGDEANIQPKESSSIVKSIMESSDKNYKTLFDDMPSPKLSPRK